MNRQVSFPVLALAVSILAAAVSFPAAGGDEAEKIYRVEGDVQAPLRVAGPAPSYPELAREEKIEGRVVARATIDKSGAVEELEIVESLGEAFDQAVLETLPQWVFEPATLDGEPVKVHYHLTINFRLGDKDEDSAEPRGHG